MISIIEAIDDYTNDSYTYLKVLTYGFCELMTKSTKEGTQVMPVTIPERKQVALNDQYNMITWIRWAEPARFDFSENWSFGRTEAEEGSLPLRIVLAHKASLGEELIYTFARGLSRRLNLSGFKYVFMNGRPVINPDHETIYRTELGDTVYERHRFTWNLYTIEVTYNFIECIESTP